MNKLVNPIIEGFYPDPTICRVGDDYYIACSSFELVPGLPIFHSKDLAHWEQICYAMTEENGLHMEKNGMVGGIMAPTLRYHKGTFYIMNTNFCDREIISSRPLILQALGLSRTGWMMCRELMHLSSLIMTVSVM